MPAESLSNRTTLRDPTAGRLPADTERIEDVDNIKPLIGPNYEEWVVPAKAYLSCLGYGSLLSGKERPPLKPTPPASTATTTAEVNTKEEVDPHQPESNDPAYMALFHRYYRELQHYGITLEKDNGAIRGLLSPALQRKY